MKKKIEKKTYYRIKFKLASAMSVGSGDNRYSDGDIIRDSRRNPFIPGTSLAGIYRSLLNQADADAYFGALPSVGATGRGTQSKVLVYDAKLVGGCGMGIRDCVKLDEWKTSVEGSKFDFETVEPGAEFVTYLEQNLEDGDGDICEDLAAAWIQGRIYIGKKTMRGLGSVEDVEVCRREFALSDEEGVEKWLDFQMYDDRCWDGFPFSAGEASETGKIVSVKMVLHQKGGISIRRYTTKMSDQAVQPDSEQITYLTGEDGKEKEVPFIPGTTWAGAFRHHMEKLLPGSVGDFFGFSREETKEKKKSVVRFSESIIEGAQPKLLTRNAIDRFTGGVIDNALFSEKTWYGGKTELTIEFPKSVSEPFKQAMAASIVDLHTGLLSVGGLTSVGRGIFEAESMAINGEPLKLDREIHDIYHGLFEAFGR